MTEAEEGQQQSLLHSNEVQTTDVWPIIHMIRADIMHFVDTPLSYDALTAPDLIYTLVRPLEEKYNAIQRQGNKSVVFCFLLNRVHFLRDQNLTTQPLSRSRAALCEILAIRTMRAHGNSMLDLALALTTSWSVYSGCDPSLVAQARLERDDIEDRVGNALEMAIVSHAKRFIKSSPCQKVIDSIWNGKCVYQAQSNHSILSDTYKRTPIHFYDPYKAPLLDHYRLKVPGIRSVIEYTNFLILFFLFVVALELHERNHINAVEAFFMIYALGFTLERVAAMQEHGIHVFFRGIWNGVDLAFVGVYCTYIVLRCYGVNYDVDWASRGGLDCLALIACLMFPRLAFVTLENNLMVLALRAMLVQFFALMFIAAFCFAGFMYGLWTLSRNQAHYAPSTICWWMLDLYFGLDASGFHQAAEFHPFLGPLMMVTYACLSNTLLVTVLVSILSHTFSTINEDAVAEAMYRKAVSTIEGVKADYLFSYSPPINIFALCIMLPARYILTPRWLHKMNVFMIRLTNFPVLLCIAWYERHAKRMGSNTFYETFTSTAEKLFEYLPRGLRRITIFEGLAGSDADIDALFEIYEENQMNLDQHMHDFPNDYARQPSRLPYRGTSEDSGPYNLSQLNAHTRHPSATPPATPSGRRKLVTLLHKATDTAQNVISSPLAQIFKPLLADDDMVPEQPLNEQQDQPQNVPSVSYGPASRRQLLSLNQRQSGIDLPSSLPSTIKWGSSPMEHDTSRSIEQDERGDNEPEAPETAAEIEEEEEEAGGEPRLLKRLSAMEERQKRIEVLLIQLNQTLGSK